MFFSSQTVDALIQDHKDIRSEVKLLKNGDLPMSERKGALDRLVPKLESHSKREEVIIYSFMKGLPQKGLRNMAFEGEEEHAVVNRLIELITQDKNSPEKWLAKTMVLGSLIENHVDNEESTVFPLLKKSLDDSTDADLCRKYENYDTANPLAPQLTPKPIETNQGAGI